MLFAFNGVITPTDTLHAAAWKRLFDEFLGSLERRNGRAIEPFDAVLDYVEHVDGRSRYEGVAAFLRSRGVDLEYGVADDPPSAETCCGLGNRKTPTSCRNCCGTARRCFPTRWPSSMPCAPPESGSRWSRRARTAPPCCRGSGCWTASTPP